MIQYIKNNIKPLLIGLCIGLIYSITLNFIENIILKLVIINYSK